MFRYNIILSLAGAALAVYIMVVSAAMPAAVRGDFGPGSWPLFLGGALLVFSLGLIVESLVMRHFERGKAVSAETPAPKEKPPIDFSSRGLRCIYKLCILLFLFALMLRYGNFLLATFVFVPACMWLLGMRDKIILVSVTVGLPISIYFIFTYLLSITLP